VKSRVERCHLGQVRKFCNPNEASLACAEPTKFLGMSVYFVQRQECL
jgi:hypothetical protein